jgi:cytochrome c-type biogenesis protein CcmE
MKLGLVISIGVAAIAIVGMTSVFVGGASPYVTIKDAHAEGRRVHVVGDLDQKTLVRNTLAREVRFELVDETGRLPVRYVGPPQSNLDHATRVVVIGKVEKAVFEADQMLVKCPSKYESESSSEPQRTASLSQ